MIQKKICLLGAFAVGKSSLVQRYVSSIFSDGYSTMVGVRIHKKEVSLPDSELKLIIWDLAGEDGLVRLRTAYLRGSSGYLLVADGTRSETLEKAIDLHRQATEAIGPVPFLLVINKVDRSEEWALENRRLEALIEEEWPVVKTSAKTGEGVELAFWMIAEKLRNARRVGNTY